MSFSLDLNDQYNNLSHCLNTQKLEIEMQPNEGLDFAAFLEAVREYEVEASEIRTTAHTSSVAIADWEQVEKLRAKS